MATVAEERQLLETLREKYVLGEYGAFTRPYVILDVDEYRAVLDALDRKTNTRRVPREQRREETA